MDVLPQRYGCPMANERLMRISRGGQLTVPAEVRQRWGTDRVTLEDHGDHLLLRPRPDPVDAFRGFAARAARQPRSGEAEAAEARGEP
jgi:bifunctional DNA-binding transcriptional regulator/antitoxin component of YhaV-PrlF toxin-antitoxin module